MSNKARKSKKRSGSNPSIIELRLKSLVEKLSKENSLLNGEASMILEELYKKVEVLEARVKTLESHSCSCR